MRPQRAAINLAVALVAVTAGQSHAQGKSMTCETANFAESVRAKMPSVRKACLEIQNHDGVPYAVLRAKVTRVSKTGVEVRFIMPDGSDGDRRFIETKPDQDVLVEGDSIQVHNLAVGQILTTYLKVSEPVVAIAQPPSEPAAAPVPLEDAPPRG